MRRKFRQKQLLTHTPNLQTPLIGLEACAVRTFSAELCPPNETARHKDEREESSLQPSADDQSKVHC